LALRQALCASVIADKSLIVASTATIFAGDSANLNASGRWLQYFWLK
jgi:hypothetical protein